MLRPQTIRRRAALGGLAALLATACSRSKVGASKLRVVSVSPSTTEAMFAIGAGDLLVGRSRDCDFPKEAEKLPVVGGFGDPNVEVILGLAPTLVVGAQGPAGPRLAEKLKEHGIDTFFPETESFASISVMLEELGRRVGREEGAHSVVAGIEAKRKALVERVATKPKVRVLFVFDLSPLFVAGPGSFPDELIALAGGDNVIKKGGAYPTIGVEHLLALAPEVLLDGATDMRSGRTLLERVADAPGFRELAAVREKRVRLVGSDALRPGPRIGDGVWTVARAIHGDTLGLPPP